MRRWLRFAAIFAGVIVAGAVVVPAFADDYIVRDPRSRASGASPGQDLGDFRRMSLSLDQAEQLRARGFEVEKNNVLWLVTSFPVAPSLGLWGLDAVRSRDANSESNGAGEGVTVCLVDTGVDVGHPALEGKIVGGQNFSEEGEPGDYGDRNGHGTHLAGIIAGRDVGNFRGVAPAAKIYVSKAFRSNGGTTVLAVAQAIRGCIGHGKIMNFSFGANEDSPLIGEAIEEAHKAGITMFAAVGNSGGSIGYPARHPRVVAVSAMTRMYVMAETACRGTKTEFFAPGSEIFGPVPGGYRTMSGTSMATAFASGVEAIRQSRRSTKLQGRYLPTLERPLIDAYSTAVGGWFEK